MTDNNVEVKTIVVLYERQDNIVRKKLDAHLSSLKNDNLIEVLCDQDISAGTEWKQQINTYLDKADIILLLISPDFIASKYNYSFAMKRALERHHRGEARVIPIIIRPSDWESSPFSGLKALPTDAKPISTWGSRDKALLDVVKGIRNVIVSPSAQEPLSQPTSEKPSPLKEKISTKTNEPNLPSPGKNPSLSLKVRIILGGGGVLLLILASIGSFLLLNRPPRQDPAIVVPTPTSASTSTAILPTPTIASLSPTSNATAMPMPTATSMPRFIPTPPQKAQAQPTPLPVVNVKFFQSIVQNQQIILSDFSSSKWNRGPQTSGTCTIPNQNQNQTMVVASLNPAFSCEYNSPSIPAFFALRVQILVTKGSQAGLTFSIQNAGTAHSYSLFKIDTGNHQWFFNDGVVGNPQSPSPLLTGTDSGIARNQAIVLGIIVYKQTLYLYINDVFKQSYTYSASYGTIGMYIGAGCQAIYTQPTVWQLGSNLNIGN